MLQSMVITLSPISVRGLILSEDGSLILAGKTLKTLFAEKYYGKPYLLRLLQ
tara:strand:+ start:415 stop:570 length:156 start_codon:yes stop_codon:yes gene_type:complete